MTLKNFRRILESELKKENDFVDPESGDINYIKVKDSADKLDQKLIALLADNEELKSKFFTKIFASVFWRCICLLRDSSCLFWSVISLINAPTPEVPFG